MTCPARVLRLTKVAVIILGRLLQGAYWLGINTLLIGGYVYHDPVLVKVAWLLAGWGVAGQCLLGLWPVTMIERGLAPLALRFFGGTDGHA